MRWHYDLTPGRWGKWVADAGNARSGKVGERGGGCAIPQDAGGPFLQVARAPLHSSNIKASTRAPAQPRPPTQST
jgi:hypothetical protein